MTLGHQISYLVSFLHSLKKATATYSSILALRIPWKRSLASYSLWGRKESDSTERLTHFIHKILGHPALSEITEEKLLTVATL